ncbi:hypothetical protein TNCV_1739891 [Trichonephila clavipes]|nr:hypothetical protein TNCV_1739891 [Trichonephila clavipes]
MFLLRFYDKALYLDSQLDNAMDQSLPSSNNSTRPGTLQETNCQRLQDITTKIKKFVITENLKATINSLKINGITDERDLSIANLYTSLEEYEKLHQLAANEFSSLPLCNIPSFTVHHKPNCAPAKNTQQDFPPLPKTTSVKRKENDNIFISPPSRKLTKNLRTNSNPELNFKVNLENKFNALDNFAPQ